MRDLGRLRWFVFEAMSPFDNWLLEIPPREGRGEKDKAPAGEQGQNITNIFDNVMRAESMHNNKNNALLKINTVGDQSQPAQPSPAEYALERPRRQAEKQESRIEGRQQRIPPRKIPDQVP